MSGLTARFIRYIFGSNLLRKTERRTMGSWVVVSPAFLSLSIFLFATALGTDQATAQDSNYQVEMATAVRAATNHVLPSVVSVEVIGTSGQKEGEVEQDAPTSGVIVDPDGFILVSSLVTARPSATILVVLPDGTRHAAELVAQDHHRDLVLLKIKPDPALDAVQLPSDSSVIADRPIGSTLISVGRYGADQSPIVSTGIFSARGRLDGIALQTDARVPPAMYGGPMIDLYGNVLGILIPAVAEGGAESSTSWYDSGIAFAIPTDVIAKKIDRLKEGNDIRKGLVGIVAGSRDLNASDTTIAAVRTRSPAEAAGIKAGDQVISVAGIKVRRHQEVRQALGSFDAGEIVKMRLLRSAKDGEKEIEVEVTLTDSIPPLEPQRLGVIVSEETIPAKDDSENESAVVSVDVVIPESAASDQLRPGDQIIRLGKTEIDSVITLRRQMISMEADQTIKVELLRDGESVSVELQPRSIAGKYDGQVPKAWDDEYDDDSPEWTATEIKLPNAANAAAFTMPMTDTAAGNQQTKANAKDDAADKDADADDAPESGDDEQNAAAGGDPADVARRPLGLLLLLLEPGKSTPMETVESWKDAAAEAGVVVCAVAAEDPDRWRPKELSTIAEFAKAIQKKANIDPASIAVGAVGALSDETESAADSMALAVAVSQSEVFFGVAVSHRSKTPAVRLRENEPTNSLQVLMSAENEEELPAWSPALQRAGYPVAWDGEIDPESFLDWVRLLQAI